MRKVVLGMLAVGAAVGVRAAPGGRESFAFQQAMDEMQRVSGQTEVLQSNLGDLANRVTHLEQEAGKDETEALKAEIASLKAELASVRRQLERQRGEIVEDIVRRLERARPAAPAPAPAPAPRADPPPAPAVAAHRVYVVQKGDNLSLIAEAFGTQVATVRKMNNLRNNVLRVGQKLKVPAESGGKGKEK